MSKKFLGYVALAFFVFMVMKDPASAAATTSGLGDRLADAATSFGAFFTALTGGGQ